MRRGLFLSVFAPVAAAITLALLAFGALASSAVREFFFQLSYQELGESASLAARALAPQLAGGDDRDHAGLDALVDSLAADAKLRLTYVDIEGRVLADSEGSPVIMQNHLDRPEIRQALVKGRGSSRRRSDSLNTDMAYSAVAVRDAGGRTIGVMRASLPMTVISAQTSQLNQRLALIGAGIALAAALLALGIARSVARPLKRIRDGAADFASGRLDAEPLPVSGPREISDLASSLNAMASELDGRMELIERQKREAEAVLIGMAEGVVVLEGGLAVRACNPAALRLFGTDQTPASLIELCHDTEIVAFAQAATAAGQPMEGEAPHFAPDGSERQLRLSASPLEGGGLVLVINDITRLGRLERVRRDFVSNVSHELKTPVTVIRSALETMAGLGLPEGRLDDPQACARFLESASRQTERLSTIIDDLLSLARIEEEEKTGITLEKSGLRGIAAAAIEALRPLAEAKGIEIAMEVPEGLAAPCNPPLLEQALVNLLDNAIKYSPQASPVAVEGGLEGGWACIRVRDRGPGIPAKDRARIFERFYRVDPGRSRELGGTGLGLSIVKHIAKAHGGSVSLESEEGRGCLFIIRIPA
jgi:two-component system phosphate regulon sensor histidine kinase PhoR